MTKSRYFGTKYKITHKPSLKGKVANRRFDGRVLKPSPCGEGAEQSEADEG